jgi:Fe-S-cluster-containing dehydrogenase component|uniref:4Fe-4S dicluster domain-containing protein n=1 Tax=Desulfobacca acetoxidans TaxID=60893 RepID=A0A7C5AKN2_9BACT
MGINRREFIKLAGLSTLFGLGGKAAWELLRPGQLEAALTAAPKPLTAKRWAMVVDMRKLDEATAKRCIEVCHRIHNVPNFAKPKNPKDAVSPEEQVRWEVKWIWLEHFHNAFPGMDQPHMAERLQHMNFLLLCNHCDNPPCVRVCPTKATFRREDGVVMMDMHRCIGCRYCMAGCPFSARSFNWRDPRPFVQQEYPDYPTREPGMVEKCDFCAKLLAKGQMPACVVESQGALIFGDLADETSPVREALKNNFAIRRKPFLGTNPQVYYIV